MKNEIPAGVYNITLEHHPNQREHLFVATIVDGKYRGRGFPYLCGDVRWLNQPSNTKWTTKGRIK